jgi:hypothetical protein
METGNKVQFLDVYKIDVNDKTEKKGNLTYLSWAWAWAEFKKVYPTAQYTVKKFNGLPYVKEEGVGAIVYTEVTADGITYEMWLPVMDGRNQTVLNPKMTEINKTIMRCLTKNLAMFGLGLYIYAGEDLPEVDDGKQEQHQEPPMKREKPIIVKPITRTELVSTWGVTNAEETILWFEKKFQKPLAEWTEEETDNARVVLNQQKKKREQENEKRLEELRNASGDSPF